MKQDSLYGWQGDVPFDAGSPTSADAAASIEPADLSRLEALVLAEIERAPRTCDEIEQVTRLKHQTVSARVRGLVLRDRIVDSGERRETRSGRRAIVWAARAR